MTRVKRYFIIAIVLLPLITSAAFVSCATSGGDGDNFYSVSIDTRSSAENNTLQIEKGQRMQQPPEPVKNGYVFDGWYTAFDYSGTALTFPYKPESDTKIYAKWTVPIIYTPKSSFDYYFFEGRAIITQFIGEEKEVYVPYEIEGCPVSVSDYAFRTASPVSMIVIPEVINFWQSTYFNTSAIYFEGYNDYGSNYGDVWGWDGPPVYYGFEAAKYSMIDGVQYFVCGDSVRVCGYEVGVTDVVIQSNVNIHGAVYDEVSVSASSFKYCSTVEKVTVQNGVKEICGNAFEQCVSLVDISLGSGIENIEQYAFRGTSYYGKLSNWDINLLYINTYLICAKPLSVFKDNTVIIKEGTTLIGVGAFANLTVEKIYVPECVKYIGAEAFRSCEKLTLHFESADTSSVVCGENWNSGIAAMLFNSPA